MAVTTARTDHKASPNFKGAKTLCGVSLMVWVWRTDVLSVNRPGCGLGRHEEATKLPLGARNVQI